MTATIVAARFGDFYRNNYDREVAANFLISGREKFASLATGDHQHWL